MPAIAKMERVYVYQQESSVMTWQPISTAPKNADVLVFCSDAAVDAQVMVCRFLKTDGDDSGDWYEQNPTLPEPLDVSPSHWMPLPGLPEVSA